MERDDDINKSKAQTFNSSISALVAGLIQSGQVIRPTFSDPMGLNA